MADETGDGARRKSCGRSGAPGGGGDWVEDWNAEFGRHNSLGRLTRDLRSQERADMRNRFLSIDMDAKFVSGLVGAYRRAGCAYPVFANLRNGLWYGKDWDGTCYFKSTDGHSRRWAFSYTRLNLHLAAAAAASGGCIVVDSTRAGKRFPDSLTATVPIWCSLLNRLAAPEDGGDGAPGGSSNGACCGERGGEERPGVWSPARDECGGGRAWDTALHTPRWLSDSEASQIEERMPGWIQGLGGARGALTARLRSFLKKPLRPVWINPESRIVEEMVPAGPAAQLSFTPVICVSASKVITPERHREHHSWAYLQGAGDDEEHWSRGITPEKFWANHERLVGLARHGGGERGAFDRAVEEMITRNGRKAAAAAAGGAATTTGLKTGANGGGAGTTDLGGDGGGGPAEAGGVGGSGHGGAAEDAWPPGGPELHAVLGSTGLVVGSLAYAARNWPSQGEDCFLLNLSDQAFPERLVEASTGPTRRYLHIPVKEGKKANPPRYWKTEVFPAALAFIASALGGAARPEARSASPPTACSGDTTHTVGARAAEERPVAAARADEVTAGGSVSEEGPPQAEGQGEAAACPCWSVPRQLGKTADATAPELSSRPSAEEQEPSSPETTASQADEEGRHDQPRLAQEQRRRQRQRPPEEGLAGPPRVAAAATGGGNYTVLVVCPTGAEASVIVCLCALVAFFSPPALTRSAEDCGTSAGGYLRQQQQQLPSTSAPPQQPLAAAGARAETAGGADGGEAGRHLGGGGFSMLRRRSSTAETSGVVTKAQLRWRFLLVQQECPWARPPRRLMQQLNEYFMTPGEHSWWTLSDRLSAGSDTPSHGDTSK